LELLSNEILILVIFYQSIIQQHGILSIVVQTVASTTHYVKLNEK